MKAQKTTIHIPAVGGPHHSRDVEAEVYGPVMVHRSFTWLCREDDLRAAIALAESLPGYEVVEESLLKERLILEWGVRQLTPATYLDPSMRPVVPDQVAKDRREQRMKLERGLGILKGRAQCEGWSLSMVDSKLRMQSFLHRSGARDKAREIATRWPHLNTAQCENRDLRTELKQILGLKP